MDILNRKFRRYAARGRTGATAVKRFAALLVVCAAAAFASAAFAEIKTVTLAVSGMT